MYICIYIFIYIYIYLYIYIYIQVMEQKQWPRKSPSHRVSKETMKVASVLGPIPARGGSYEK